MTSALAAVVLAAAPAFGNQQPPGTNKITTLLSWGAWGVTFACVFGVLAVAAGMAVKHRRGEDGSEQLGRLGWVLGAVVLGSAAGPLVNALT